VDIKQNKKFHAPLHPFDTEQQTHGCRHTNPIACSRHNLPTVCAFVREENICLFPSSSWAKQFKKLKNGRMGNSQGAESAPDDPIAAV
jgi:hypothetical protein